MRVNVADIRLCGLSIVNKVNERTVIRKLNGYTFKKKHEKNKLVKILTEFKK